MKLHRGDRVARGVSVPTGSRAPRQSPAGLACKLHPGGALALVTTVLTLTGGLLWTGTAFAAGPPEAPETGKVEPLAAVTATVHGTLDPQTAGEVVVEYDFFYAPRGAACTEAFVAPEPAGMAMGKVGEKVEQGLTGLEPNTEYAVCLATRNSEAEPWVVGNPVPFKTLPVPDVSTGEATGLQTAGSATLNGTVNPNGLELKECKFEYVSDAVFKEPYANEVQAVRVGSPERFPFFTLTFDGETTVEVPSREAPEQLQAALEALPSIGPGNVAVTGGGGESRPYEIEFTEAFAHVKVPELTTSSASEVSITVASAAGDGGWHTAASIPCAQGLGEGPGEIGAGAAPVAVSAGVSGLTIETLYDYRLVAANANGAKAAQGEVFYTPGRLVVEGESSSNVTSTAATVAAQIDPGGTASTYDIEYGVAEPYAKSAEVHLPAATTAVEVQEQLTGLQPGVEYHFRFVAHNAFGTVTDEEKETFTATAATGPASSTLPDDRAYELVSSPTSNATVYPPVSGSVDFPPDFTFTLVRAAAGGDAVLYQAGPPSDSAEGGSGGIGELNGNPTIATRGSDGWRQTVLQFSEGMRYEGFSSELSVGVLNPELFANSERAGVPSAVPAEPAGCAGKEHQPLFSYTPSDGGYHALVSSTPTSAPTSCDGEFAGGNPGTATVPQYSHVLFQTSNVLTPEAVENQTNLYDSVGGQLHLVSVLPDGQPDPTPQFVGGVSYSEVDTEAESSTKGSPSDISADGSRVFWTDLSTGDLYVRENDTQPQSALNGEECTVPADACTVLIAAGGEPAFDFASRDGSKVFFADQSKLTADSTAAPGEADLYEYEVNAETGKLGALTDLTVDAHEGEHAHVQFLWGESEDGSYLYFAADGVLGTGKNVEGKEPVKEPTNGQYNIYLYHEGEPLKFVATADGAGEQAGYTSQGVGDGGGAGGTSEATPDGHSFVFRSRTSLTGYENDGLPEVFVYDADTGRISCASCDPAGAPPTSDIASNEFNATLYGSGASLPVSWNQDFMLRWISEDGARVFFDTGQPLVPQDINGLQDVYEWERPNSGSEVDNSCTRSSSSYSEVNGGCVYLLSGGTSTDDSYLLDASASGNDVFLRTRAKLVPGAVNENMALYDARVGGGFPETSQACEGTGCQGVPSAPPIFATPSSATITGVDDLQAPPPAKPNLETRSQKLAKALRVCRRDRAKKKRVSCEATARKRYGAKAKKSGKKTGNDRRAGR